MNKNFFLLLTFFISISIFAAQNTIEFHGNLKVDGNSYFGDAKFKFALINQNNEIIWSNDGSADLPALGLTVPVNDGSFFVILGENNTAALSPELFAENKNLCIRTWVDTDNSGYKLLEPDKQLFAVPYAFNAAMLDGKSLEAFAVTSDIARLEAKIITTNFDGKVSIIQVFDAVQWIADNGAAASASMKTTAEAGDYLVTNALVFVTDDDRNSGGMIVRAGNRNRAIVHIAPDGLKVFADGDSPNHVVTKGFLGKVTNSVLLVSSQNFANVDAKLDQKLSTSGGVMFADIVFDSETALRHADGANFIQFQSPENEMFVIAESRTKSIQISENYEGDFLLNETDAGNLSIKESGFGKMILSEKDDDNQEFREEDEGDQIFSETGLGEQLIFSDSKTTISSTNIVIGSTVSGAVVSVVGGNISLQGDTTISGVLNLDGNSITGVKSIVTEKLQISQTSEFHKIAQFFAGANFNNTEISGVSTITVAKIITSGVIDPLGIEFIPTNAKPSGFSHPVLWASNEVIRNLCWEDKTVAMKEDLLNSTSENWPNGAPNFYVKENADAGNSGTFENPINESEWISKGNGAFHFAPGDYDNITLPNNGIFTLVGNSGQDNFAAKFDKITIPANGSFNFVNLNIDELNFSVPAGSVFASVNFYNCKINSLSNETEYLNLCLGHFYLNGDLKLRVKSASENAMVHASGLRVDGNWNIGEFGTQHIVIHDSDSSITLTGDYPLIIRKTSGGSQPALQCEGNFTMQGGKITDLANPQTLTDAVNLDYLNTETIKDVSVTDGLNMIVNPDRTRTISVDFAGSGESTTVTRSDHTHDTNSIDTDIISSINGIINDGGNIDIVAGGGIVVQPDANSKSITISQTAKSAYGSPYYHWFIIRDPVTDPGTVNPYGPMYCGCGNEVFNSAISSSSGFAEYRQCKAIICWADGTFFEATGDKTTPFPGNPTFWIANSEPVGTFQFAFIYSNGDNSTFYATTKRADKVTYSKFAPDHSTIDWWYDLKTKQWKEWNGSIWIQFTDINRRKMIIWVAFKNGAVGTLHYLGSMPNRMAWDTFSPDGVWIGNGSLYNTIHPAWQGSPFTSPGEDGFKEYNYQKILDIPTGFQVYDNDNAGSYLKGWRNFGTATSASGDRITGCKQNGTTTLNRYYKSIY